MKLVGKTILIISPEPWGTNFVSKHHYAVLLAKRNNKVFFLNPPQKKHTNPVVEAISAVENLYQINYSPRIQGTNRMPVWLKNYFQRMDIQRIIKKIPHALDIVWSFDPYRFQNLRSFRAAVSVFHPVDFFNTSLEFEAASRADLVISVSREILAKYPNPHKYFINHGVGEVFLTSIKGKKNDGKLRCGYVGNLRSFGLDIPALLKIVKENPEIEFHFIGPNVNSNLGGSANEELDAMFTQSKNVIAHGSLRPEEVATRISSFDFFLICYRDNLGEIASNSHKLLEYLSTGKVVVSSWISTYESMTPHLFEMVKNNSDLPSRFKEVASRLDFYNSESLQETRKAFANDNSYEKQIERIEELISVSKSKSAG
ncbi:MAG: hypothetical protein JSS79_08820 [Bacteroidetes bacterium]|nr:hypothetical protein [Bacteroidota bacterium]